MLQGEEVQDETIHEEAYGHEQQYSEYYQSQHQPI